MMGTHPVSPDATAIDDLFLLIDTAAQKVGISRRSIYNWIRAGEIETKRTIGGSLRVRLGDVQIKARRITTARARAVNATTPGSLS